MRDTRAAWTIAGLATSLLAVVSWACGPGGGEPGERAAAPAPAAPSAPAGAPAQAEANATRKAELIFSTRCATCHGPGGAGDGAAAAGLEPGPRDFRDARWQASVTDAHLRTIIVDGGSAVGRSPLMPPNPDLAGQPDVVDALVAHVRSLGAR